MSTTKPEDTTAPKRILLVEDSPSDAELVQEMLHEVDAEAEIVQVDRLSGAERCLGEEQVECLLLDLSLPDASGVEGVRALSGAGPPVVVLTGADDEGLAHRALSEGAQDYLIKGECSAETIGRAIAYAVERKRWEERTRAAEWASRAKSELLSRMSHELRTPLNAVLGFAQLLQADDLDEHQADSVEHIVKGGRQLLRLVDELLDISRIESGKMSLSLEPVDLGRAVSDVLVVVEPMAAEHGIRLRSEAGDATGRYVAANEWRLEQVLLNLLSNAVKYTRQGGEVSVSCSQVAGERLQILVCDTGPGIAPEDLDRLFLPFDRLGAERAGVEGTGVGLSLSKQLTEAMGGTLTVESEPGRGTKFYVELALAAPAQGRQRSRAQRPLPSTAQSGAQASGGAHPDRPSALYIGANPWDFELVQRLFERDLGMSVVRAMEGRLAIELAKRRRPDLVLLDLQLPDTPATEVLARLKAEPLKADIPVIVVSADASARDEQRLLGEVAEAFLTKPLDVQRFLAVARQCLAGREIDDDSHREGPPAKLDESLSEEAVRPPSATAPRTPAEMSTDRAGS